VAPPSSLSLTHQNTQDISSPPRSWLALPGFLLLCYAVAAVGAYATAPDIPTWYAALTKPSFNPPNWIFAPVWTILYTLMALAAWLVWRTIPDALTTQGSRRVDALVSFYVQLALNFLWTPIFFHFHQLLAAAIIILLLWLAIALTIILFWRVRPFAGAILIPYLAWVSFATALNLAILRLN
jgi:translocator protein